MTLEGVQGIIISSVVPGLTDVVREGLSLMTGLTPLVVGHGIRTGIRIATDHPASLGSDLVVDAVAATEEYSGTIAIFDMGTATTCSVVDDRRSYLGTLIMHMIGKNTIESMQGGLIYGNAAMVDGLIERIEEELGCGVTVLATGGIAGVIVPHCRKKIIYDPDLLLKGLWYIYHKNVKEN